MAPTSTTDDGKVDLGTFEGKLVLAAALEIPGAAGGLRDPMQFDPKLLHMDDEGTLTLRYKVRKVRFDPIKDTAAVTRVAVLDITEGAFLDDGIVDEVFAAQRAHLAERRAKAEAEAKGAPLIDFPTDEELYEAHQSGDHGTPILGCADCRREAEDAGVTLPDPPDRDDVVAGAAQEVTDPDLLAALAKATANATGPDSDEAGPPAGLTSIDGGKDTGAAKKRAPRKAAGATKAAAKKAARAPRGGAPK